MNPQKRYEIAWTLRQSGKTFREIGEKFCVSSVRARQLVKSHTEQVYTKSNNVFVIEILKINSTNATQILNGLSSQFGNIDRLSPSLIASISCKDIRKIRMIGEKSAHSIALALENIGCIKDSNEWET